MILIAGRKRKLNEYPESLIKKRKEIECNFVLSLWKDPDSIGTYNSIQNGVDIITEDGTFYYGIAQQIYNLGYRELNSMAVYTFLADKKVLQEGFDIRGGYNTVNEITSLLSVENIDSYYDEVVKNNALLDLYDAGFDVEGNLDKFQKMTSDEIYDYLDYKINDIFVNKVAKLHVEDMSTGYDDYVEQWNEGVMKGFPIGYSILNYRLAGVHKKNLLLHMAHIGNGKTTSSILFYILPAIENGENVCIIANEQGNEEFRQMILSTVLFNRVNYRKMNRQRFIQGGFSDEDLEHIELAKEWLEKQDGKIIFIETADYSVQNVKKIVRKYSKIGYGLFIFDTLKPEVENSSTAWADFSETAKELFMVAKQEDVAIIATAQLSAESMGRKFLDLGCVGKSRAIAETATQVVMFRTLSQDEKEKITVYNLHRDEDSGKLTNIRDVYQLDLNKDYIVVFIPKNRFGDTRPQIVYERNMAFNTLKEVGLTEIDYDGFFRR
ncbi:DnaB-like helicase C-terminal domain-containing protein [Anaerovoracaceae bacterium 41-7]